MGWKDLFKKTGIGSGKKKIEEQVQKVDAWVMHEMPAYDLHFDIAIPKNLERPKYIPIEDESERYRNCKNKSEDFIRENLYGYSGNMFNLYDLYQYVSLCMSTGIQMALSAPSTVLTSYVNIKEAASYYDNVFGKSERLCKTIVDNMSEISCNTMGLAFSGKQEDTELILYENGVKKIRDCGELELCRQFLGMFAECMKYAAYLVDVTEYIYENVPYVFDSKGNHRVIKNWEKTLENITKHISMINTESCTTLEEDFLKLIE